MADPRAGRHAGDVGDGEQLGRRAVQAGAGRPDPHGDRERRRVDALEQRLHLVATDDGAARVDLQHQRLGAVVGRPLDGVVDRPDDDRVEQPADLQHVDRSPATGSAAVLGAGRRGAASGEQAERQPRR